MGGEKGKLRRSERAKDKDKAENSQESILQSTIYIYICIYILVVTNSLLVGCGKLVCIIAVSMPRCFGWLIAQSAACLDLIDDALTCRNI
jgi:hypothetical protein